MPNWSASMQQTFEYYVVDPGTWKDIKKLDNVKSCTINRDADTETLGSATIDVNESLGECYVRVYLVTIQNGVTEKHCLGTYLVQTPSSNHNGKTRDVSMDAYTPLIELKESHPPIGFSLTEGTNALTEAVRLTKNNLRAPVVPATDTDDKVVLETNFVSNTDDTWLSFIKDLLATVKYKYSLDELGRILFSPEQDTASLQPVWTYNDDNSSILYPDITMKHDLYGIPNVVEVIYSSDKGYRRVEVVNDDPNSPTSTIARGRRITHRATNPDFKGIPTERQLEEYAKQLLKNLSSIEYSIRYTHAYCPVRLGDCVHINYSGANITGVKAKVISQSIKCQPGCPVSETAVFTKKLWG